MILNLNGTLFVNTYLQPETLYLLVNYIIYSLTETVSYSLTFIIFSYKNANWKSALFMY